MNRNRRLLSLATVLALATVSTGLGGLRASAQPAGSIGANVTTDQIHGSGFGPAAALTIQRGAEEQTWTNGVSGPWEYDEGNDSFVLYLQGTWDVQAGDRITVVGGGRTDDMTVATVSVSGWDVAGNTISGSVSPSDNAFPVYVSVGHYGQQDPSTLVVQRSGEAAWIADMDLVDPAESPPIAIRVNDSVEVCQPDARGNESCSETVLAGPRFTVGLELQEVVGLDWPAGVPVTLTVNRGRKTTVKATMTPPTAEPYGGHLQTGQSGTVCFDLTTNAYQAAPGDVITMTNGVATKSLTVPALTTDLADVTTGTVTGTAPAAPAGGFFTVASGWYAWGGGGRQDVTSSGGTWTADFGPGGIDPAGMGSPVAYLTDGDGDMAESQSPYPVVWVDPAADRVWALDFAPGQVTLTVQRGAGFSYTVSVPTTNVLTKGSWNLDMWATPTGTASRPAVARYDLSGSVDLTAGDVVVVTDATTEISFAVADVAVDSVAADPVNTVTGRASGVGSVSLHLGDSEGGYWGYEAAVVAGGWSMYFDPSQFPNPPTGLVPGSVGQTIVLASVPGSGTVIRWTVPSALTEPAQLVAVVQGVGLPANTERQLVNLLTSAQRSYDAGRTDSGARTMTTFIDKVTALRGSIPAGVADELVAGARAVIAAHS